MKIVYTVSPLRGAMHILKASDLSIVLIAELVGCMKTMPFRSLAPPWLVMVPAVLLMPAHLLPHSSKWNDLMVNHLVKEHQSVVSCTHFHHLPFCVSEPFSDVPSLKALSLMTNSLVHALSHPIQYLFLLLKCATSCASAWLSSCSLPYPLGYLLTRSNQEVLQGGKF